MIIGVISDTHGLLRPEAVAALRGADRIVHAGDVGGPNENGRVQRRERLGGLLNYYHRNAA